MSVVKICSKHLSLGNRDVQISENVHLWGQCFGSTGHMAARDVVITYN